MGNNPEITDEMRRASAKIGAIGGKKSGEARRAKLAAPNTAPMVAPPREPGSLMTLADYDQQVGLPVSWADAIKREQLVGEKLANESKQIEIETTKGKLLTAAQVKARDTEWNRKVEVLAELAQRLLDGIDGITPDQRNAYLENYRKWRAELAKSLT